METRFDLCSPVCTLAYLAFSLFSRPVFCSLPLLQWGVASIMAKREVGMLTFEKD